MDDDLQAKLARRGQINAGESVDKVESTAFNPYTYAPGTREAGRVLRLVPVCLCRCAAVSSVDPLSVVSLNFFFFL